MGSGRPVLDSNPGGRILTWDGVSAYLRDNEVPGTVRLNDDDGRVIISVEVDSERIILTGGGGNPLTLDGLRAELAAAGAQGNLRLTIWYLSEVYRIVDLGYFYDDDGVMSDFQLQRRWG